MPASRGLEAQVRKFDEPTGRGARNRELVYTAANYRSYTLILLLVFISYILVAWTLASVFREIRYRLRTELAELRRTNLRLENVNVPLHCNISIFAARTRNLYLMLRTLNIETRSFINFRDCVWDNFCAIISLIYLVALRIRKFRFRRVNFVCISLMFDACNSPLRLTSRRKKKSDRYTTRYTINK